MSWRRKEPGHQQPWYFAVLDRIYLVPHVKGQISDVPQCREKPLDVTIMYQIKYSVFALDSGYIISIILGWFCWWHFEKVVYKVNIWTVNSVQSAALILDSGTDVLVKVLKFLTEHISTRGGLEHQTFGFMPNALTIWATTGNETPIDLFSVKV